MESLSLLEKQKIQSKSKILITGPTGSGKSTLAREIESMSGFPILHLDATAIGANWVKRPKSEKYKIIKQCQQ